MNEIRTAHPSASATPIPNVLAAPNKSFRSPKAAPSEKPRIGPNRGAITIAPMTPATLFECKPIAATMVDRTTKIKKSRSSFASVTTS